MEALTEKDMLPCPMCKYSPKRAGLDRFRPTVVKTMFDDRYYAQCQNCGCTLLNGGEVNVHDAVVAWNSVQEV